MEGNTPVIDAADRAAADEARAWEVFQQGRAQQEAIAPEHRDCLDCGEPIPSQRLRTVPRTRRCQPCAREVERR